MASTSEKIVVEIEDRSESGSAACRRMRREGRIPANVYGLDREPLKVSVSPRRIGEILRLESGMNTIFTLALAGKEARRQAMIKELQRDPVSERPLHIDFVRVDANKPIHVRVPIRLIGTPDGVKNEGGVVDFVHRECEVECLPAAIPEHLDVDVSALHINQHVSVSDLQISADVKILDDVEQIIAVVAAPRVEDEPQEDEEEEAAVAGEEPDVAKKGKETEGDGAESKE